MNQEIINKFSSLTDEEILNIASEAHEFSESIFRYFLDELKNRNLAEIEQMVSKNRENRDFELKNRPVNAPKIHFNINVLFLCFITIGPILDQLYNLSTFSRDPAPESTVLAMNILFFAIYCISLILFMKKHYWTKWILFSIYSLWTIVALLVIIALNSSFISLAEIVIRCTILIYLISSHKWVMEYKLNSTKK